MEVVSSLLPATTVLWQPRAGKWALTVVCKATFVLEPGEARVAQEQDPLAEGDQYWDDDPTRSLFYASDLVPVKRRADVLLVGHAFAPGGTRVRQLVARMKVDKLDKSIAIFADRTCGTDGSVYEGRGFTRMPLVYERAAGGPTTWNPVGVRPDMRDSYGNTALPNLVMSGTPVTDFGEPVGFGPISPSWSPRSELWVFEGWSGNWSQESLPDAFDLAFFNVAPRDQQVETLRDDCMIHLENLHPEHPQLTTSLPGLRPRVVLEGGDRRSRPVTMRADALFIDADRGVATMVWRGHVALEHPQEPGRVVIEVEEDRVDDPRTATSAWSTNDGALANETSRPAPDGHRMPTRELSRQPAQTAQPGAGVDERSRAATPFGPPQTERPVQVQPGRPATAPPPSTALPFANKAQPQSVRNPRTMIATEMPPGLLAAATPFAPAAAAPVPAPPIFGPPQMSAAPASLATPPPVHAPPPMQAQPPPMQASMPAPLVVPMQAPTPQPAPASPAIAAIPPPVRPPLVHAQAAALGGLAAASNAAADPTPRGGLAGRPTPVFQGDVLHLLWFEPEAAPRVRRRPEWKKLLDEMENGPADPEVDAPGLTDEPAEMEDRREVFEVLAHGTPSGEDGVQNALLSAVRSDGRFAPQLLLLSGEIRFDFDELETLKANVSAATPLAGDDAELKSAIEQATKLIATPDLVISPEIVDGMTKRIREAFVKSPRVVGPTYLEDQTERALIERRAYQKRDVFGQKHLRSLFFHDGSTTGVPTYLPEALAKKLPLFRKLRVRMLVEAHFQADQYESHSAALKAAAVARMVRTS